MTGEQWTLTPRKLMCYFARHNVRYVRLWRRCNNHDNILNRLRLLSYAHRYGLEISPKAKIGSGLYLGHAYNITVAEGCSIGKNCNLHKGCTIGTENRGERKGTPSLGDCVYVGINSMIVGNVWIGNDVMIAPGTYINFDVPDHSVVIGNPGIIHHKENATHGYIAFRVDD